MDVTEFIEQFQDYLAPRLDAYEQAIYLYVFRHSRLLGLGEVTLGFKSARSRMATGVGEKGKPMSEKTAYDRLASLQTKGCIEILSTHHKGRLLRLRLPSEIPGIVPVAPAAQPVDLETMDFFNVAENRRLLLDREGARCFYTLEKLTEHNFVVEHVISRPVGNNTYRNCVAASREANNRKGNRSAEEFLRDLYRAGYLDSSEFEDRMRALADLRDGKLRPILNLTHAELATTNPSTRRKPTPMNDRGNQ